MTLRDTLVFFATDPGYAFPTVAAIRAFRDNGGCGDVDVALLAVDFADDQRARLERILAPLNVSIFALESRSFVPPGAEGVQSVNAVFSYLSLTTLARLVVARHVAPHYRRALYIDADTWCVGDMRPLLDMAWAPGRLYAAPDPLNFFKHNVGATGRDARAYFAGTGVPLTRTYFNTGVMAGEMSIWREAGEAALAFFFENTKACVLLDQSALNAVAGDRFLPMSHRWNFATQLRVWGGLEDRIAPRLMHFTGPGKPWLGPIVPWADFTARFDALRGDSELAAFAPAPASPERVAALARRPTTGTLKAMTFDKLRDARVRRDIVAYERSVLV